MPAADVSAAKLEFDREAKRLDHQVRMGELRFEIWKWVVGGVVLSAVTIGGSLYFQERDRNAKDREVQLEFLKAFTDHAINDDLQVRIWFAHYVANTIDAQQFKALADEWEDYYRRLMAHCPSPPGACEIGGIAATPNARPIITREILPGGMTGQGVQTVAIGPGIFIDPNLDVLTYHVRVLDAAGQETLAPAWMCVDRETGTLTGDPPADGVLRVRLYATDPAGEAAFGDFDIHMRETQGSGASCVGP